jgi:hypothetical protein
MLCLGARGVAMADGFERFEASLGELPVQVLYAALSNGICLIQGCEIAGCYIDKRFLSVGEVARWEQRANYIEARRRD